MAFTRPKASQINFDVTNISDPLVRINSGQAGSADKDSGIVIERGDDTNVAILYDESADQFVLVNTTEDGSTSGNVTISSYAGLQANAIVYGSLNDGTTTLTATVAELNILDGVTATTAELNYVDGVTSNIQTQIDNISSSFTLAADSGSSDTFTTGQTLTIAGGTGIDTTVSDNQISVAIDSTVATLTGTQTLTNKTLTSPTVNTPTITTPTITGNATFDTNTLFVDATNNRIGIGTTSPAYQVEIENTGANALLVLDRTDGAACFIEGQATRSAFGSVGATPLALAYNSFAVVIIGENGAITVNPDGDGYTFPTTDGSANQFLQTDGSGALSFASATVSDISDLTATAAELNIMDGVTATTAELNYTDGVTSNIQTQLDAKLPLSGGTMSGIIAGFESTGIDDNASSTTVTIDSSNNVGIGTSSPANKLDVSGAVGVLAQNELKFYDSDSSHYTSFRAASTVTSSITWTLPNSDGTDGQVLTTNGGGTLSWADQSGGGGGGGGSSYPNSTITTIPGADGNYDLSYNAAQTIQETPFESGGTDAFGVNLGTVFSLMDPVGSVQDSSGTGLDLGTL